MNTGLYIPQTCESLEASRRTIRMEIKPPERANDCLPKQSAALETRTEELEACVSIVIHKLKSSLSVIIRNSNGIFNITDLTHEELYEYLQQIRFSAYKMDEIINNLLLYSEMRKADAP